MNDINRLRILQDVIDRRLTICLTASRLEISDRHCSRLIERYREHRPLLLVNRRRVQPGSRQLMPPSLSVHCLLSVIRGRYLDFDPTLIRAKLAENHSIVLGKEKLRRLTIKAELWGPHKQRAPKFQ